MQPKFRLIVCEDSANYTLNQFSSKLENQHDKLFKDLLNDKQEVKNFLFDYLNINIKTKEIERCSNSYISEKYGILEADIVYKIKDENIYILIEHQSSVDEIMSYRILNYCTQILKEQTNNKQLRNKNYKFPLIIPVVLYTGERKWTVERNFSQKIENNNNEKVYMEMKYELIDINQYSEEELLQKNTAISYGLLIEKNKGKDSLINILNKIALNCTNKETSQKMQKIIQYLLYPILENDTEKMVKKFRIKEEFDMKTAQDYIREEIAEIRRQGIEEGRKEGRKEGKEKVKFIILNMIKNKVEIEKIKEYTGIKEEEIQKIVANM